MFQCEVINVKYVQYVKCTDAVFGAFEGADTEGNDCTLCSVQGAVCCLPKMEI